MADLTGQIGLFCEDDIRLKVRVIVDDSDKEWRRLTLEVLEVLKVSRIYRTSGTVGERFSVSQKRGVAYGGMWSFLTEMEARRALMRCERPEESA